MGERGGGDSGERGKGRQEGMGRGKGERSPTKHSNISITCL